MSDVLEALKEFDGRELVLGAVYDEEEMEADDVVEQSGYTVIPPLKALRPIHIRILAFHLSGVKGTDIVRIFKDLGIPISYFTVHRTIHDPLAKSYLQAHTVQADAELRSLDILAVDAIRDSLSSNRSIKERLMGADRVFKSLGRFEHVEAARETAEDVISRALDIAKTQAETVRDLVRPNRVADIIDLHAKDITEVDETE